MCACISARQGKLKLKSHNWLLQPVATFIFFFALIFFGISSFAFAQFAENAENNEKQSPTSGARAVAPGSVDRNAHSAFLFRQLWDDLAYVTSEPDFYLIFGAVASAPTLFSPAFANEEPEITEHWGSSPLANGFFEAGEYIGQGSYWLLFSTGAWAVGKTRHSSKLAEFGSDMFRAHVINVLFTATLKGAINRTRPNGAPYSYPSGHTSTAFTTAGSIYAHFGKSAGFPAFVMATYVGLSRLQKGKHFATDVLAGGILGGYVGLKIARRNGRRGPVSFAPYHRESGVGLAVRLQF